jgi:hypothetical protein
MKEGSMDRNRRSKKALGHLVSFLAFTGASPPALEGARPSRKRVLTEIASVGALVAAALMVVPALATTPSGVNVAPLAPVGHFDEIKATAKFDDWKAKIETKGLSDLHIVQVTIDPGGTLGWHSHLGPSFVIVKSGTATFYEGDDPTCTPHVFPAGSSLAGVARAGVGVWTTNGPEGGDTRALAVDPANPAKLYAGTSGGGVFKSTNRGASWPVLNTGLTNRSVNALAIDPATSREVIVEHGKPEILSQDAFAHKQSMRTDADEIAEVVRA